MAINRYRYYLGPLGVMSPLPPFPARFEPEVTVRVPVADHVSLEGRSTQDRLGRVRRAWACRWEWLTEDEELRIQAALRGQAGGGLRLLDPRKRNIATEDISTTGAASLSLESFTFTGAGAAAFAPGGGPLDLLGITGGRIALTALTNGQTLYGTGEKTPVITGSSYRISAFVKSTTTFKFSARPFDLLGAEGAVVLDPTNRASTAGVWSRFDWNYTPAAGVSSFYFGITATGSGTIDTAGWMYQIDESLKNWTFGYGCPEVLVSAEVPTSYWRTKYHNLGLALREV